MQKYERELARLERKSAEWRGVMSDPTQPPGRQKALFGRLQGSEVSGRPAPGTVNARALRLRAQIDALKLADRVYQADPTTETRRRLDTYLNRGARIRDERDWVGNERKALRTVRQEVEKLQGQPGFGSAQAQYMARYNAYLKRGGLLRALEGQHVAERKTFQNYQPQPAPTAPPFGSGRTPSRTGTPQPGEMPARFASVKGGKPTAAQPVKPRPGALRGPVLNPFTLNVYGHQPDFGEWAGQQAVKGLESIGRVLGFGDTIDASKLPSKQYAELYPQVYLSQDAQRRARELAEIGQLRPHVAGVISPFVKAYRSELGRLPRTMRMLIETQSAVGVGAPGPSAEELRKAVPQEVYDRRYAEAVARSLGGMNEQRLIASFEARLGRPLTSLQKKAVGAIAAAERLNLLNEGNYTQALSGDLRNVVIGYAAGAGAGQLLRYLKGPAAGLAQKLGTRLSPKTQAAMTTTLGKTSTQAQRLAEPVRKKVPPVVREALVKTLDPVEHTAAGVSEAAIQAFEVASDPQLTPDQRAAALQRAFVEGAKANLGFEAMLQGVLLGRHLWHGRGKVGGADLSRLRDQIARDFRNLEHQLDVDPEALDRLAGVPGLGRTFAIVRRGQAKGARFGAVEGYGIVEIGGEQNGRVFVRAVGRPGKRFDVPANRLHEFMLPKPSGGTHPPAPTGAPTGKPGTNRRTRPQGAPPPVKPTTVPQTAGNPKPGPNATMHPPNSMAGAPKPGEGPGEGPAAGGKKAPGEKASVPWSARPVDAGTGGAHGGHGDPSTGHLPRGMEPPGDGLPQTARTAVAEPPSGPGKTGNGRATQDPTHSSGNVASDPRADYPPTPSRSLAVDDGAGSGKTTETAVGGKPGREGGASKSSSQGSRTKPYGRSGPTSPPGTPPPGGAPPGEPPPNAGDAPPGGPPPGPPGQPNPKSTTAPARKPGAVGVSDPGSGAAGETPGLGPQKGKPQRIPAPQGIPAPVTTRGESVVQPELPGPPLARQLPPGQKVRHITGLREAADWLPWFLAGGGPLPREIKAGGKEILAEGRGPYSVVIELDPQRVTGRQLHAKSEVYGLNHIGPDAVTAFVAPNRLVLRRYRAKPGMEAAFDFENVRKVKHGYRVQRRVRQTPSPAIGSQSTANRVIRFGDDNVGHDAQEGELPQNRRRKQRPLQALPGPEDTSRAGDAPWSKSEQKRQRRAVERAQREIRGIDEASWADFSQMPGRIAEQIIDELVALQRDFHFTVRGIYPSSHRIWWSTKPQSTSYFETDGHLLAYGVDRWHPDAIDASLQALQAQEHTSQASKSLAAAVDHDICHMLIDQAVQRRSGSIKARLERSVQQRVEQYRQDLGEAAIVEELGDYAWYGTLRNRGESGREPLAAAWKETIAQAFSAYRADRGTVSESTAHLVEDILGMLDLRR